MLESIRETWAEFESMCGSEPPLRSRDELVELIHMIGLRYEQIDDRFWNALFDTAGTGYAGDAWAFNADIPAAAAVERYEALASPDYSATVCQKLDLTTSELNALYTNCLVDGHSGIDVAARLRERYQIDDDQPLGAGLVDLGVLTLAEGEWLDDVDVDE